MGLTKTATNDPVGPPLQTGIEAISVYLPCCSLDLAEIATRNQEDPHKYYDGLGLRRMAVPSPNEDTVTMAANAALRLFERYAIDPAEIGMVLVSTETGIDASKSVAAYVHGLVGLPAACRTVDVQHGCYGSTAALKLAAAWAAANRAKKALVIASDIATYREKSPGEPTQGAAAVAMIIGDNPKIARLTPYPEAVHSNDVMDFWRPNYSRTPFVEGRLSIECYLDGLENVFGNFARNTGLALKDFDALIFHTPFPKMVYKAYHLLAEKFGDQQLSTEANAIDREFLRQVEPALWAARYTGNTYNASLYMGLAAWLEDQQTAAENRLIGMYGYGSGYCCEFFALRTGSDSAFWNQKIQLRR